MPSKSDSARTNGAKSRGPSTPAGRARSSQNSLKHGLNSAAIVLPSEDPSEFANLLAAYTAHLQPHGPIELDLVHEMAAAKWRLDRIAVIETQLFTEAIDHVEEYSDDPLTPVQALASAFRRLANGNSLAVLHRAESRLTRSYSRALRNLLQLQRTRQSPPVPTTAGPGENKICQNEPTDSRLPSGYLTAPDLSTTSANLLKLPPITGHLQHGGPGTIWKTCTLHPNNARPKVSPFSI
jgi:hypothetical protein